MLVALLSTLELAGEGASCPRSFLIVGGQTVLFRQARQAIALGCGRIICISNGLPPEVVSVQHMVERAGARFHTVRNARSLGSLIDVNDEIIAIGDGILPDMATCAAQVASGPGVLVFPAEQGLPAGYERLDRDRCWTGVVRCHGGEIERLADLPEDIDPLAALMRSALQSGHPPVPVPAEMLTNGDWWRIDSAVAASTAGRALLLRRVKPSGWTAPGNALADRFALRNAEDLLRKPAQRASLVVAAATGFLAAGVAAYFGSLSFALLSLVFATLALRVIGLVRMMANEATGTEAGMARRLVPLLADLALLAIMIASSESDTIYPTLVLLGVLFVCSQATPPWLRDLGKERAAILLLIALGASMWAAALIIQALSLALLAALFVATGRDRLTVA